MELIISLIMGFIAKYPVAGSIFAAIGFMRAIFKPLSEFLHAFVLQTPTKKDDAALESLEKSKGYEIFKAILNYVASIKLS